MQITPSCNANELALCENCDVRAATLHFVEHIFFSVIFSFSFSFHFAGALSVSHRSRLCLFYLKGIVILFNLWFPFEKKKPETTGETGYAVYVNKRQERRNKKCKKDVFNEGL